MELRSQHTRILLNNDENFNNKLLNFTINEELSNKKKRIVGLNRRA